MNYYALFYHVVDDFISRRAPFREEHLRRVREANRRGELLLAGALGEPPDRALLIFRAPDRSVAEEFARNDSYVVNGLVARWEVHPWANVISDERSAPIRPSLPRTIEEEEDIQNTIRSLRTRPPSTSKRKEEHE